MPLSNSRASSPGTSLALGIDLVAVGDVAAALARFGSRYTKRLFTPREIRYCMQGASPDIVAQRFAARFAAKEAAFKALRWGNRTTDWRDIEVLRARDGWCELALHAGVKRVANKSGVTQFALSMSHEAGYATAVVTAWRPHASPTG